MSSTPISPQQAPAVPDPNRAGASEDGAHEGASSDPRPDPRVARCLNCDTELHGRYCANCGQDSHRLVLSLWHALSEVLEEISQADARVWRTLKLLVRRPGELTCEFLRGKRASYTPPLRLYVALSLLFFVVTLIPAGSESKPKTEPIPQSTEVVSLTPQATRALDEALEDVDAQYRAVVREQLIRAVANVPAKLQVRAITHLAEACGANPLGIAVLNSGVASHLSADKLRANCKKVSKPAQKMFDDGTEYAPKMMMFFLPLIALFGKFMYAGSRRYYIGHLVFFVHFHAFVFLAMAAGKTAGSLAQLSGIGWLDTLADLVLVALIFGVPIYLYKAMRRVYGQGRAATRTKFLMLGFGYAISFGISAALLSGFIALQTDATDVNWKEVFNIRIE